MENKLHLTDLIDVDTLQSLQDVFADMIGIAALTADKYGVAVTKGSNFSDFCTIYTRGNPIGRRRCENCDRMGATITYKSGKPCTYHCHAGLIDFAAPIMANGKIVGSFIGGQVLTEPPDIERTMEIALEMGIDPNDYVEAIKKVKIVSEETVSNAAKFLCTIANQLSKIAYNGYCLHQSNIKIEKANKMKSDFLANMSHEIRTPMNAVLGMADLALREQMSPAARDYLHQIKTAGKNLIVIINDILDFSKIESGKMDIIEVEYEPMSVINDLSSIVNNRIGNKNIEFTMDIDPELPQTLWGDNVRIHQIMLNILTNAVKFTKEGQVHMSIRCKKNLGEKVILEVCISDTGMGIKKEDCEKIFNSFQQVDSKRNRNIEGTGLGLAISQQLLNLMDGDIRVDSEYGKGTAFTFELPQKVINSEPSASKPERSISSAVLIHNEYVRKQVVKDLKWICSCCTDLSETGGGPESIEADYYIIEKSCFDNKVEDFFRLHPKKQCFVIDKFNSTENYSLPNVRSIRKPVYSLGLYNAMGMKCAPIHQQDTSGESNFTYIAPEAHILIVDDNHVNLVVSKGLLEPLEMQVDTAASAAEAIEKVRETVYDLIFMDHMMPEMDGVEATHIIRNLIPGYSSVPIIALSANAIGEASEMFIKEGMNDFVAKPIELKDIVSKLRKWLPQEKIIHVSKNQEQTDAAPKESDDDIIAKINFLNVKDAVERLGNTRLFMSVLREYYKSIDSKYESIMNHKANGDIKSFTIEVHALKSTSRQIGAELVANLAADMEAAGNAGNIQYIEAHTETLMSEFIKYKDLLRDIFPEESEDKPHKAADNSTIIALLDELRTALDEFDTLMIDEVVEKISAYQLPSDYADYFNLLKNAAQNSDIDTCADIAEDWKKALS